METWYTLIVLHSKEEFTGKGVSLICDLLFKLKVTTCRYEAIVMYEDGIRYIEGM